MYARREMSRIIGLDLSKRTFRGCILSGDGFERKEFFDGTTGNGSDGLRSLVSKIRETDIVLMKTGSSTFKKE